MKHEPFIVPPGKQVRLKDFDPRYTGKFTGKEEAREKLAADVERLAEYQDILYAQDSHALLIIFQALDAAGKDSTIKHVMTGVNPLGTQVFSFKAPSAEELDHDYLWRCHKAVPERGRIGIFNRSYYEETIVVRVHPEFLANQRLPAQSGKKDLWEQRFAQINNFERYLVENGIEILKFFLNVSKEKQRERFLARLDTPEKNWKFSVGDVHERGHWDEYQKAFEDAFNHTSTEWAPWYIIPADHKWFAHAAVADIIVSKLKSMSPQYPKVSKAHVKELAQARKLLESE
ncbi:MAG TPA: polyphosphate kinase 2 family protein [Pyrinomonadaceae bacterium]|nr:polyphosphate kinase 2 family protein [Pyrinomonadaceae bacterium]